MAYILGSSSFIQRIQNLLQVFQLQESNSGLHDVSRVGRRVVRILGIVVHLNDHEPIVHDTLITSQRLANVEVFHQIHSQVHKWPENT